MEVVVAIHQPNFLPWLGYFDKIARADRFVILDSVPLQLTGGNYTNRVKMIISGKPSWLTMPLRRGHDARNRIDQAEYVGDAASRRKLERSIAQSYAKAPFFSSVMPLVERILGLETTSLVEFNLNGIYAVAEMLGLPTDRVVRSNAMAVEGHSSELLARIVRTTVAIHIWRGRARAAIRTTTYLPPTGSRFAIKPMFTPSIGRTIPMSLCRACGYRRPDELRPGGREADRLKTELDRPCAIADPRDRLSRWTIATQAGGRP